MYNTLHKRERKELQRGDILITVIIMMAVFALLFGSLADYLLTHYRFVSMKTNSERALQIAEAGIEYYRWRLSHFPENLTDGTGVPGPYVHTYEDPEIGPIGKFSLEIGGDVFCGKTQVITATSTGWTLDEPGITRTIVVQMARPTVADYSYIVDSHVHAGATRIIIGPYHSNGVVRMEADNRSAVTSKIATYSCNTAGLGGCSGTINGVYGGGSHPEWWRWAQPDIPFTNFDAHLDALESVAQTSGIYLEKVSNGSTNYGYYLDLKSDKTIDIYQVTGKWSNITSTLPNGTTTVSLPELAGNINTYRTFVRNQAIPATCPLIYASDHVWLSGVVNGKVTVVANATSSATVNLYLQNNITYSTSTGADGLTVLAEEHLIIPLYVPTNMTINGVFMAQKGAYGRNYYPGMSDYNSYRQRASLTTNGTVVSKMRTGTSWTGGNPDPQGFVARYDNYDRNLAKSPPPMTPYTSPDFRFISWREVR